MRTVTGPLAAEADMTHGARGRHQRRRRSYIRAASCSVSVPSNADQRYQTTRTSEQ
jgi:hypothetical protein